MEDVWVVLLFVLVACIGIAASVLSIMRARQMVRNWADACGMDVLAMELRWFRKGPYFWSSKNQFVFYVKLRDTKGRVRNAYIRCGSWFLGILQNEMDMQWDS